MKVVIGIIILLSAVELLSAEEEHVREFLKYADQFEIQVVCKVVKGKSGQIFRPTDVIRGEWASVPEEFKSSKVSDHQGSILFLWNLEAKEGEVISARLPIEKGKVVWPDSPRPGIKIVRRIPLRVVYERAADHKKSKER